MIYDPRVDELMAELLESGGSPEEVCRSCPELLPQVRAGLQQLQLFEQQLDALFPPSEPPGGVRLKALPTAELPNIPGYEVHEELGRGGVGVVYRARHLRLDRTVALKMLLAGPFARPEERERFLREAQALARLGHPNIVQVHDFGELGGLPYFAMEYVEGGSLAHRLAGTPRPPREAAALAATLAEAIEAAHRSGIVHRDLKPANVLLTAAGTPKVADFGLARRLDGGGATLTGTALGTPSYMAPEQARGERGATGPPADIYALGAMLYEMLTGRPPFRAETPSETVQQVIDQDPVPPARLNPKVPRDLETICLKCLHKDPQRRYASAAALADDLRCFGEGRPIQARRVGWGGRLWRWVRRKPAEAALVATALTFVGLALGGGLWLERQRAEQRTERARQEGRASQAAEAALEKSAALQQQGGWQEARVALEVAQGLLNDSAHAGLVERLRQARADADMVAKLEEIRLRLSEGRKSQETASLSPERMYADAFRTYGFPLLTLEPAEAAARVRNSAVREPLLAFLHDWFFWVSDENRDQLQDMLDRADDDAWRHAFRIALVKKDLDKLNALAHAPEAPDQPPVVLSGLASVMVADKYGNAAPARLRAPDRAYNVNFPEDKYGNAALALFRETQQRHPGDFWINYLLGQFWYQRRPHEAVGYWYQGRPHEAVGYFRVAVAIRPTSDHAYSMLGRALRDSGDAEGAIAAFRQSVALNPNSDVVKELSTALAQTGRLEETRTAWEKRLELDPPGYDSWYGYAELCLFLGREDDYRGARRDLLTRFGATTEPFVAERAGRACLLSPGTDDELRQAVALAERAVDEREGDKWGHAYFQFVHGLAEYRQGLFDRAISTMRGDASRVLGPAPRLVLAMALHRSGRAAEARETLAAAVLAHDWRANQVHVSDQNGWIYHVLRREAENLILTTLPAFLDGKYQPQDNDERLALLGICQFRNRTRAMARLYADAFAASQPLADDLGAGHLYNAARAAALAGCGHGEDAKDLEDGERKRWRDQARQWLRAELAARARTLDADPTAARWEVRETLTRWQKEPDLACVRDPGELNRLAADERKECFALWAEVATVLARTQK